MSSAPILDRSDVDPFLTASPCVLMEDGLWRMWYVSGVGWQAPALRPVYHLAETSDREQATEKQMRFSILANGIDEPPGHDSPTIGSVRWRRRRAATSARGMRSPCPGEPDHHGARP